MSKICSLRGISAPQLTPFREDGSVNYGEYTRLTQFITDAGVHGVFVCGTTGEFVNLTLEERKRLLTAAVEGAGPESCILFNTTAMNLADMKELFDWARHEGAHAASVTAPYYHSYDAETLTAYFRKAAELAEGMPLYLYNMPGMTHNPITPKVVQEVCDTCPNVAGLKDSSMDFLTFQEFQCLELPGGLRADYRKRRPGAPPVLQSWRRRLRLSPWPACFQSSASSSGIATMPVSWSRPVGYSGCF